MRSPAHSRGGTRRRAGAGLPAARAVRGASLHDARSGRSARRRAATGGAWADVAPALGVDAAHLERAHQVHGASVVVRRAGDPPGGDAPLPQADILVSDDPSIVLAIQTADCVPLLIADRRTGAVAAAHAGWRGLAAGVPGSRSQALARAFGTARPISSRRSGPRSAPRATKSGDAMCGEHFEQTRVLRRRSSRAGFCRARAPATGSSTAGRRRAINWKRRGVPADLHRVVHGGDPDFCAPTVATESRRAASRATSTPAAALQQRLDAERASSRLRAQRRVRRRVHSGVREAVGVGVLLAADVLEGDARRSRARACAPGRAAAAGPRSSPCSCRASAAPAAANRIARAACGGRGAAPTRAPRAAPRYSATLLVATPIDSANSSISLPSGCSMRTPKPAGPGIAARAAVDVRDDRPGRARRAGRGQLAGACLRRARRAKPAGAVASAPPLRSTGSGCSDRTAGSSRCGGSC